MEASEHRRAEPLATRHVFFDTQVYRGLGHNPDNQTLALLREHIYARRIVLHTTDLTLLEIKRQIRDLALAHHQALTRIEKDFHQWRQQAPKSTPKTPLAFDADALSSELFRRFSNFLKVECRAEMHWTLISIDHPEKVFAKYFGRKPPFDEVNSKEFPDAFVIEELIVIDWANKNGEQIYVVSRDKAMIRAVDADPHLLNLSTIHDVLTRAAADLGPENEAVARSALTRRCFLPTLERLLKPALPKAFNPPGELLAIKNLGDWSVVNVNANLISVTLELTAKVRMDEVAVKSPEGEGYYTFDLEDNFDLDILIKIDRNSGEVVDAKVLNKVYIG